MLPRQMGCGSGSTCWRRLVRWQRIGWGLAAVARGAARRTPPPRPFGPAVAGLGQRVGARSVPLVAHVMSANINDITQLAGFSNGANFTQREVLADSAATTPGRRNSAGGIARNLPSGLGPADRLPADGRHPRRSRYRLSVT